MANDKGLSRAVFEDIAGPGVVEDWDKSHRRIDIQRMTTAELAIREARIAVEKIGAHPILTDAVVLLSQAQTKVADYVDGNIPKTS